MTSHNQNIGKQGEKQAFQWYTKQGYRCLDQNFTYYQHGVKGRIGEIDLIVIKEQTLVFVEVKTRNSTQFGNPFEQITSTKQTAMRRTAEYFLSIHNDIIYTSIRFDICSIVNGKIDILQNAL